MNFLFEPSDNFAIEGGGGAGDGLGRQADHDSEIIAASFGHSSERGPQHFRDAFHRAPRRGSELGEGRGAILGRCGSAS